MTRSAKHLPGSHPAPGCPSSPSSSPSSSHQESPLVERQTIPPCTPPSTALCWPSGHRWSFPWRSCHWACPQHTHSTAQHSIHSTSTSTGHENRSVSHFTQSTKQSSNQAIKQSSNPCLCTGQTFRAALQPSTGLPAVVGWGNRDRDMDMDRDRDRNMDKDRKDRDEGG